MEAASGAAHFQLIWTGCESILIRTVLRSCAAHSADGADANRYDTCPGDRKTGNSHTEGPLIVERTPVDAVADITAKERTGLVSIDRE